MAAHSNLPKAAKNGKMRSSPEARRLIRAAIRRHKTQRAAARALGLPNDSQLIKMLRGTLHDTPAMKASLARADKRARRAWSLVRNENVPAIDDAKVKVLIGSIRHCLNELKVLLPHEE